MWVWLFRVFDVYRIVALAFGRISDLSMGRSGFWCVASPPLPLSVAALGFGFLALSGKSLAFNGPGLFVTPRSAELRG